MQASITSKIRVNLKRKWRFISNEPLVYNVSADSRSLLLGLFVRLNYVRHSAPGYLNLNVVRLHAQYKIIIVHPNDGPDDPATGHDRLTIDERLQHLFLVLLLTSHRHEHQKIED